MAGQHDVHLLNITKHSTFVTNVGPPPPSPPASVERIEEEEEESRVYAPRLTMPSHSEPPVIYDEPESIIQPPPRAKSLHRASTDTRVSLATLPMSQQHPSSHPSPMPIPEPSSRVDGHIHPLPQPSATTTTPTTATTPVTNLSTSAPNPSRRHTTGSSAPKHHQRLYQRFAAPQPQALDDTAAVLGDAALELQSDIKIHSEQIRRERQSKRAKQQAQAEAEAALTRTDTRGTRGTKEDDDSKPLVGNLIGEDHVNYVLMYNMLTGIRIGVSRCQAKIKRPLTEEDFTAKHKYSFDM